MDNFPSQLLSFALIALTTFIPTDSLRYIALGSTLLSLVGYAVFINNLSSQAAQCETYMKEIEALFTTVTNECVREPVLYNGGWITVDISLSELRMRMLLTSEIAWRAYPLHLKIILLFIAECRQNFKELRSSMQVTLERARQQVYIEDINQKRRTLEVAFAGVVSIHPTTGLNWCQCMKGDSSVSACNVRRAVDL
ncbi:hypothetical protein C8J57DRAFT_1244350 [Mycena rebaudengoi]|nr:hypothetical protein C8J57DRAFT_1244350 [Mycena rebaudengoi]